MMVKLISKIKNRNKNKKINSKLSEYPCDVFLHNALRFLSQNKPEVAYAEICYAITKSGGDLTEAEKERFKMLRDRELRAFWNWERGDE